MPRRKKLYHAEAKKWSSYDLDGTVEEVLKKIADAAKEAEAAGFSDLRFSLEEESDWGEISKYPTLTGTRMETLEEMRERVRKAREHKKKIEDRDLAQLAALKEKYEGKGKKKR